MITVSIGLGVLFRLWTELLDLTLHVPLAALHLELATGGDDCVKVFDNDHSGQHKTLIRLKINHLKVALGDRLVGSFEQDRLGWVGDQAAGTLCFISKTDTDKNLS